VALKDRELNDYYETMFDLHAHPGWELFMQDVQRYLAPREEIRTATPDTLEYRRGEVSVLDWLLVQSTTLRAAYEQMEAEEAEEGQ
jgi:hypothetical protein